MAIMNRFLINKWNNSNNFGATLNEIMGVRFHQSDTYDPYFFLRNELDYVTDEPTFRAAQRSKTVRHCKPYNGVWLDYTAHKQFNTLDDWAADAGATVHDILYGVNRVHRKDYRASRLAGKFVGQTPKYVTLQHLLDYLGYVPPLTVEVPVYNAFDRFSDIFAELEMANGPVPSQGRKCLIHKPDNTIVIGRVVDQKHFELENTESQIRIVVPQETPHDLKSYGKLSEMPDGMKVYVRNSEGSFQSLQDLMAE